MSSDLKDRYASAKSTLEPVGQSHLLTFYDELDDAAKASLLDQIEAQDWAQLAELVESHVKQSPELHLPKAIEPAPYYPADTTDDAPLARKYTEATELGRKLIHDGKVAAFTVAGGQGTRLGWDGPKGTYPATPVHHKPLFQVFAESIVKIRNTSGALLPWYIMTSPINDAATRAFFVENEYFGLLPENVFFFEQGTVPSFSSDGKALLADRGVIATNPDGHGGSLRALASSGALADMQERGIEQISYFQVDNPLVRTVDPLFVGLHVMDGAQMSSKMVEKTEAGEKVGVFVEGDGKVQVIEYSDLPGELSEAVADDGLLLFNGGSIAIHVIAVDFVAKLNEGGRFGLPYHRAVKKVPHVDLKSGKPVEPSEPNAVKLETFVFDALPLAETSIVVETLRRDEFGPIKNAEGADSVETSQRLQSDRAGRWLRAAGVNVPMERDGSVNAVIELSPLTAIEPDDLKHTDEPLPTAVNPGAVVAI